MWSRNSWLGGVVPPFDVWPILALGWIRLSWNALSARSRMYGIHPAPPSERITFRFGNRSKIPLIIQSTPAIIEFTPLSDTSTVGGASSDVVTRRDELPMCMQIGRSAWLTAAHSGSQ